MSEYRPWKELERRHARRMGGERLWRPDYSDSKPDGQCGTDTWDCKALSRQAIVNLFRECEKKYREFTGSRRFHLCLFDPTRPRVGDLVVLRADAYAELVAAAEVGRGFIDFCDETDEERTQRIQARADEVRPFVSMTPGMAKTLRAAQKERR